MSKIFYFLVVCFIMQPAWSVTFDWEGFSRVEFYHAQSPGDQLSYGNFHTVLKPEIQVVDGLSVYGRLDLYPYQDQGLGIRKFPSSFAERQTGLVFVQDYELVDLQKDTTVLFLNMTQFYLTYETDFFQVQLGKAPHHFGLGTTYSAESSAFDHWISNLDQVSLYFEYFQFYVQPIVYRWGSRAYALVQGGLTQEDWSVEALYRYDIETSDTFLEVFGQYEHALFDSRLSISYFFEDSLKLGVAFEGGINLASPLPKIEVKAGYASQDFFFHPNYNIALLLWNRMNNFTSTEDKEKGIAEGRINGVAYFSPSLSFYFIDNSIQVQPVVSMSYTLEDQNLHYEADLNLKYLLENNFSISLQGGLLHSLSEVNYSILSQATVTF